MPLYTVDRFEGPDWALLEDESARPLRVPRSWLPVDVREGDVINASVAAGSAATSLVFELNPKKREERLRDVRKLREGLPSGPKGDLSL